ncbi:hypothetical protein [Photorhabdus luminescens]|uniref:Uncharacterized protein n=1 Tax=Photorhabdus luminescens subsp. sonorensis TaxID=1173677 RepID=A0A5C4RN23_PHOLU|nr:hypothetical protein [Photorhabdus luminescens]TNH45051.1 hypothetical protein EP164_02755 [Photorhabdus luminescens subsp. sonorensis]
MNIGVAISSGPNLCTIDKIIFGTGVADTKFRIAGADCIIDLSIRDSDKIYLYNLLLNAYYIQATITVYINKNNGQNYIISMETESSNLPGS